MMDTHDAWTIRRRSMKAPWASCDLPSCRYWDHEHHRCGLPPGAREPAVRGEELTLEEVGQRFGLTRERIRQIEEKALAKLGHVARGQTIRELFELVEERPAPSGLAGAVNLCYEVMETGRGKRVAELRSEATCRHPTTPGGWPAKARPSTPLPPSLAAHADQLGRRR